LTIYISALSGMPQIWMNFKRLGMLEKTFRDKGFEALEYL